jgi:hypothetical protein
MIDRLHRHWHPLARKPRSFATAAEAGKPLHVAGRTAIRGGMKIRGVTACLALSLLLPACRKPAEVTVDEQRVATKADEGQKLDATSNDRFQEPGSAPILAGVEPQGWLVVPPNEFRILNYRFGTGGEVAVGIAKGGLLVNLNRWMNQFKAPALDEEGISKLEHIHILGVDGVWVEAHGDYNEGMGREMRTGQALAGVIALSEDKLFTVKMTGPEDEVAAQKEALKAFVAGLRYR